MQFKYDPSWSQVTSELENQLHLFPNNYAIQVQVITPTLILLQVKMYVDKKSIPPYLMDPLGLPVSIPAFQKVSSVSAANTVLDAVKALTSVLS